jgi:hypothetical protein
MKRRKTVKRMRVSTETGRLVQRRKSGNAEYRIADAMTKNVCRRSMVLFSVHWFKCTGLLSDRLEIFLKIEKNDFQGL